MLTDCDEMIHYRAMCSLQLTEESSFMCQNWVVLLKRDMPVDVGQARVSR